MDTPSRRAAKSCFSSHHHHLRRRRRLVNGAFKSINNASQRWDRSKVSHLHRHRHRRRRRRHHHIHRLHSFHRRRHLPLHKLRTSSLREHSAHGFSQSTLVIIVATVRLTGCATRTGVLTTHESSSTITTPAGAGANGTHA